MKRLKRLGSFTAAAVIAFSALLNIALVPAVSAATISWDGEGNNNDLSDPLNWSGDALPSFGDDVMFDLSSVTTATSYTASSIIGVNSMTFTGTPTSGTNIDFSGSNLSFSIGLQNNTSANIEFANNVTLTGTSTLKKVNFKTGGTQTLTLAGGTVTVPDYITFNRIAGAGSITANAAIEINGSTAGWSGSLSLTSGTYASYQRAAMDGTNPISIASGAVVVLCSPNGATIQNSLSVSGNGLSGLGAIVLYDRCNINGGTSAIVPESSAVWSGAITLGDDASAGGSGELKITGSLSGAHSFTQVAGSTGRLVIAASPNSSKTANGTYEASVKTTEYKDNNPNTTIDISSNNIGVVTGSYGDTYVRDGGIIKGTGTLKTLSVISGGTVAPGMSPGTLNTGDLSLQGTYQFEVGGTTPGTGYDQIKVTGTVDVTDGTLEAILFNGFVPAVGQSYTIIDNDAADAVTGTFTDLAEGAEYTNEGVTYSITYAGGDGNDVVLTVTNVDAASLPKTPDTGFALITSNPIVTFAGAVIAAGAILVARRRLQQVK